MRCQTENAMGEPARTTERYVLPPFAYKRGRVPRMAYKTRLWLYQKSYWEAYTGSSRC